LCYTRIPPPPSHPLPTRRSSDLLSNEYPLNIWCSLTHMQHVSVIHIFHNGVFICQCISPKYLIRCPGSSRCNNRGKIFGVCTFRSEEHTSELQSRFDLVCRLLLD